MQMNGYYFNYIGKTDRMVGVIAQEIEPVLKEVVYEYENIETEEKSKAVYYGNITALLIEAMKEQQTTIESLKQRILVLENIKN
jgi:ribulose 1,5-bisphosphate carboxylase large subunit-like protein